MSPGQPVPPEVGRPDDSPDEDLRDTLTLGSLLTEPLLRYSPVVGGTIEEGGRRIEWCLPWAEALTDDESLEGVVVVARSSLLEQPTQRTAADLDRIRVGGAAALIVLVDASRTSEVEELARGRGLPVVIAAPTIGFSAINHLVAEKRLAQDAHAMAYGVSVHRELADVLYRGSGLSAMARRISRLSSSPAFLLDTELVVLAYESLGAAAVPDPDEVIRTLRNHLQATDHASGSGHTGAICMEVRLEHQLVSVVVDAIVLGGTTYGWVVIVELEHPPHPHDLAQHLVVAEQAVMISGSEMLRLRSIEETKERARGDFVHALLHGRFANPHELASRAAHHAFDVEGIYTALVVRGVIDGATTQGVTRQPGLIKAVQQLLPEEGGTTIATSLGDLLVVVRKVGSGQARAGTAEQEVASHFADGLLGLLEQTYGGTVAVAFGRPGRGVAGIMSSYREARVALEVARRLRYSGVSGYGELRVSAVLSQVAQDTEGIAFAREVFAPLHGPGERTEDLESVLIAYIESGGNVNAAARTLYMHRNTVLYKLDKVSRLLGMDLRSAENQFTIWLAYRIRVLAEVEADVEREIGPPA